MAEEALLENFPYESDEAFEGWEFDEAIAESDEGVEDIGERVRRRRRRSHYRPGRGVRGIALRGPDGGVRNVPFPAKLATTEETNRGLANKRLPAARSINGWIGSRPGLAHNRRKIVQSRDWFTWQLAVA